MHSGLASIWADFIMGSASLKESKVTWPWVSFYVSLKAARKFTQTPSF